MRGGGKAQAGNARVILPSPAKLHGTRLVVQLLPWIKRIASPRPASPPAVMADSNPTPDKPVLAEGDPLEPTGTVPATGVIVRQQTVTSGDFAVYLQFIIMDRSAYVWAGLNGEFGNLAVAIPPKFVRAQRFLLGGGTQCSCLAPSKRDVPRAL